VTFEELAQHADHHVEVVTYSNAEGKTVNAAVECFDCHIVIYDRTKGDDEEGQVAV